MPFFNVYPLDSNGEKMMPATIVGSVSDRHEAMREARTRNGYRFSALEAIEIQMNSWINSEQMKRVVEVLNANEPMGDIISVTSIEGPGSHVVIYHTLGDVRVVCLDSNLDQVWGESAGFSHHTLGQR